MGLKDKLKNMFVPKQVYKLKTQIEAQDQVINSLNERRESPTEFIFRRGEWNTFQWLNIYGNYFANRFKFDSIDQAKNIFISKAIRQAYLFGSIAVWNNAGFPTLCYVVDNDIKKPYVEININVEWKNYEINQMNANIIKVDRKDIIHYEFDNYALPAIYWLKPLIEWEQRQDKNFNNEQITLPTRLILKSKANNARNLAMKFMINKSPVIYEGENEANTFTPLALETNLMEIIEQDKYERARFYQLLGIRTNLERKNERNVSDEVEQNEMWFQILENERYLHLKQFLIEFSNQFKLEIYLENQYGEMELLNGY